MFIGSAAGDTRLDFGGGFVAGEIADAFQPLAGDMAVKAPKAGLGGVVRDFAEVFAIGGDRLRHGMDFVGVEGD